jgi:hypothetical protein
VSVALVIQHAKRMRHIILSSVACPAVLYFSTLSHERHDFEKKKLFETKCVFWFSLQLLSETFLILRRIGPHIINVHRSSCKVPIILHVKYPLFLSDINKTWIFSTDFRKHSNTKFHENISSGSRVVPCGQTDTAKLVVAFRNLRTRLIYELHNKVPYKVFWVTTVTDIETADNASFIWRTQLSIISP